MSANLKIYCCACEKDVQTNLVTGKDIYPHRKDLWSGKIYQCSVCLNYVGTHKKSGIPLGVIPTPNIRKLRSELHTLMDPLWETGLINRGDLYHVLSKIKGSEYHTALIKTEEEAREYIEIIKKLRSKLETKNENHFLSGEL